MLFCLAVVLATTGCETEPGGGAVPGGPGGGPGGDLTVDGALFKLGISTETGKRLDQDGRELPDTFSPLGSTLTLGPKELFTVGLQADPQSEYASFLELAKDYASLTHPFLLGSEWDQIDDTPSRKNLVRAAAAGDVDGDGIDEIIVVFNDGNMPGDVFLEVFDMNSGAASIASPQKMGPISIPLPAGTGDVSSLSVATADFDGDGISEIVVGVSRPDAAALLFLWKGADGSFSVREAHTQSFGQFSFPSGFTLDDPPTLELATGNIDRDAASELVVVVNQSKSVSDNNVLGGIRKTAGRARFYIYDDGNTNFDQLVSGERVFAGGQQFGTAIVADVALGDIDGDGKDEIVFAGLTDFVPNSVGHDHVYLALEDSDVVNGALQPIGSLTGVSSYGSVFAEKVFVNTIDIDGDGVDEIQANRTTFSFRDAPWTKLFSLSGINGFGVVDPTKIGIINNRLSAVVVADVTGNMRDDLIIFHEWNSAISVFNFRFTGTGYTAVRKTLLGVDLPSTGQPSQNRSPIIVPCNVDDDSIVLQYKKEGHRLVFTEPIIIAAIAAVPCKEGITQNTGACTASYGVSTSTTSSEETTASVHAGVSVGLEFKLFGNGAEFKASVTTTASFSTAGFYELTRSTEFTSGPMEDLVIFSSIPLDQYTYTVVSSAEPDAVGTSVNVSVPRVPVIIQVTIELYNSSLAPGALPIGPEVFKGPVSGRVHTRGNPDSYPTEADAVARTTDVQFGLSIPIGLMDEEAHAVGQGTGSTTTSISFLEGEEYNAGVSIAFDFEAEVSGGGATVGGNVGFEAGHSFGWGSSTGTTYTGTIGAIDDPASLADNSYRVGLFTYIHTAADGSQFEVINFWVE